MSAAATAVRRTPRSSSVAGEEAGAVGAMLRGATPLVGAALAVFAAIVLYRYVRGSAGDLPAPAVVSLSDGVPTPGGMVALFVPAVVRHRDAAAREYLGEPTAGWQWIPPVTRTTLAYLVACAPAVAFRQPGRWIAGVAADADSREVGGRTIDTFRPDRGAWASATPLRLTLATAAVAGASHLRTEARA